MHIVTLLNMELSIAPAIANNFHYTKPSLSAYYHVLNTIFLTKLNVLK